MRTASAYQIGLYQRSVIVMADIKTTNSILQIISELDSFKNVLDMSLKDALVIFQLFADSLLSRTRCFLKENENN